MTQTVGRQINAEKLEKISENQRKSASSACYYLVVLAAGCICEKLKTFPNLRMNSQFEMENVLKTRCWSTY